MTLDQPTPASDRKIHLDVLRGFALFGILLVNFEYFTRPIPSIALAPEIPTAGIDAWTAYAVKWLAEGKFYSLFSTLFGAGFALMMARAEVRGAPGRRLYLRRLVGLLGFGIAHAFLVWSGDILMVYALTAFVMMLLFRSTPAQRLWKWAVAMIAVPVLMMWLGVAGMAAAQLAPDGGASARAEIEASRAAVEALAARAAEANATGSYVDNVFQRIADTAFSLGNFMFWIPPVLGYFLLGRWLIVAGPLDRPAEHARFFERWQRIGLGVGLPLSAYAVWRMQGLEMFAPTLNLALGSTAAALAALLLSLGYLSWVVPNAARLAWLAPAGQMALTNYLCQSIVWTLVFYGYGLGFWGEVPRAMQVLLAMVFFAGQIALSHWWLRRFRFGPAEWLWRAWTYRRRPPMRRRPGG